MKNNGGYKRKSLKTILVSIIVLSCMFSLSVSFAFSHETLLPAPGEVGLKMLGYSSGYGVDQELEVTLTIDGRNIENHAKVILVIDSSGSMKKKVSGSTSNQTKMDLVKSATKDFMDILLTENSNVEVAVVDFDTKVRKTTDFYSYKDKKKLLKVVNRIRAEGGTNIQAGLFEAEKMLQDVDDETLTYVVLLSDGAPTFHYDVIENNAKSARFLYDRAYYQSEYKRTSSHYVRYIENGRWKTRNIEPYNSSEFALIDHFDENYVVGPSYSTDNLTVLSTFWQAKQLKESGIDDFFTIAYDLNNDSNARNILKHCASSEKSAYDTTVDIASTFENIAYEIKYAATNAKVAFQLNEYLEFIPVNEEKGDYDQFIIRKNGKRINNPLDFIEMTDDDKVLFNLETISEVSEGNLKNIPSELKKYEAMNHLSYYTLTYKLSIKDEYKNNINIYNMPIDINNYAYMEYQDVNDQYAKKSFPNMPTITLKGGSIKMVPYQVNTEGFPISEEGRILPDEMSSIIEYSKKIVPANASTASHSVMYKYQDQYILPLKTFYISQKDVNSQLEQWLNDYASYYSDQTMYRVELIKDSNSVIYIPYMSNAQIISNPSISNKVLVPVYEENQSYISFINQEMENDALHEIEIEFTVDAKDKPLSYLAVTLEDNWQPPNVSDNLDYLDNHLTIIDPFGNSVETQSLDIHRVYENDKLMIAIQNNKDEFLPNGKYTLKQKLKVKNHTSIDLNEKYSIALKSIALVNEDYPVDNFGSGQLTDYKAIYDKSYKYRVDKAIPIDFIVVGNGNSNNSHAKINFANNDSLGVFENQGTSEVFIEIKPHETSDLNEMTFSFDFYDKKGDHFVKNEEMTYKIVDILESDGLKINHSSDKVTVDLLPSKKENDKNYILNILINIRNGKVNSDSYIMISKINNYEIPCEKATKKNIEVVPFLKQE